MNSDSESESDLVHAEEGLRLGGPCTSFIIRRAFQRFARITLDTRGLCVATVRAVVFDFIGTLTNVKDYSMEDSKKKLCKAIKVGGFDVEETSFSEAYSRAHEKYRVVRYQELVEVTNAVWISEALNTLGLKTSPGDARIKSALNIFFQDYVKSFELRPCAKELFKKVSVNFKLGLISNFTYAPVIYVGLRRLAINRFLSAVLVSADVGWRKPSKRIFKEALKRLGVKPEETVYVGDSPLEDIQGAKVLGMKTVFVPSQFYSLEFLHENQIVPDLIAKDICELYHKVKQFSSSIGNTANKTHQNSSESA
jgi:putative hydrolase of the HAD superfamily